MQPRPTRPGVARPGLTRPGLARPGLAQPGLLGPALVRPGLISTVLITGAAGGVARQLMPGLLGRYALRLTDRRPIATAGEVGADDATRGPAAVDERIGELCDQAFLDTAVSGVDAIVHLAGNADPASTWEQLLEPNVRVPTALLDAAQAHGVRRVVLASSVHATGQRSGTPEQPIDPANAPAPCCRYGASKALVEAAASAAHWSFGMSVVCLRLGAVMAVPGSADVLGGWLGPADLRQLMIRSIEAEVGHGVYYGISANTRSPFSLLNAARELGYHPTLDAEDYAGRVAPGMDMGLCPAYVGPPA